MEVRTIQFYSPSKLQLYNPVLLAIITMLCIDPQMLFILQVKVCILLPASSYFSHPQPLATTFLHCFYEFNLKNSTYKIHLIYLGK